jgi:hypothetical protein
VYLRRRLGLLALLSLPFVVAAFLGAGGSSGRNTPVRSTRAGHVTSIGSSRPASTVVRAPVVPALQVTPPSAATSAWTTVATVHGTPAAWVSEHAGVTLLRFEQSLVRVDLHAGSSDGGSVGWTYGDHLSGWELHHVIAAFNGGFKLTAANVGFLSGGRAAVALKSGLASIVTYASGRTDVGSWRNGVPAPGQKVFSVLQNQLLLVDGGLPAANISCVPCWGETIKGLTAVARSGLGVTARGQLVWAAGEHLLPSQLASALIHAGAVRAIELDINPEWVAGYLYPHHRGGPTPVPATSEQLGIAGHFLEPYSRDFFAIAAR